MVQLTELIIQNDAVLKPNYGKETIVFLLARHDDSNAIQKLVKVVDDDPNFNITQYNSERLTPLHLAARYNDLPVVTVLIQQGAFVEAKDKDLRTPIHLAVRYTTLPVIQYLIQQGAIVDAKDENSNTLLVWPLLTDSGR